MRATERINGVDSCARNEEKGAEFVGESMMNVFVSRARNMD